MCCIPQCINSSIFGNAILKTIRRAVLKLLHISLITDFDMITCKCFVCVDSTFFFSQFIIRLWTLTIIWLCNAKLYIQQAVSLVTFSYGVQSISFPLTLFAIQAVIVTCSRLLKPSKASQCWVHDRVSRLSSEHWAARETALQELIQPPEVLFQPN